MSSYNGKLLELISVESDAVNPYMTLRSANESIDIKWEIDSVTAKNLNALLNSSSHYKYRLSFQSVAIPTIDRYYSWVTKTHGDESENLFFTCSKAYVDGLEALKTCSSLKELAPHASFSVDNKPIKQVLKEDKKESVLPKRKHLKLFIALSAAVILLLMYSGHSYIYKPALAKKNGEDSKQAPLSSSSNESKTNIPKKVISKPKPKVNAEKVKTDTIPVFQISQSGAYSVPKGSVALTFDDGPSRYTRDIVNTLKANHAGGTFFFIGENVQRYPDEVKYAHTNGYSIGNHSMHHPDFSKLSMEEQQAEIQQTSELIERLTSQSVVLFRPPYEAKNQTTTNLLEHNHLKMVLWDRDTRDWQTQNPDDILNYIKNSHASGTIILMHESQKVLEVLPSIISYLQSQHLQMVTLVGTDR